MAEPYGGISREDRIDHGGDGPWCDKAWHLRPGREVRATFVLSCGFCGRTFARCAQCNRGSSAVSVSMRAHVARCYRRAARTEWER